VLQDAQHMTTNSWLTGRAWCSSW